MMNNSIRVAENRRPASRSRRRIYKISLWFRLVLETFIRSNMGKRYYSFRQALLVLLVMLGWFAFSQFKILVNVSDLPPHYFLMYYGSYLLFMLCFLVFAIIRKIEASRNKGYSLGMGLPLHLFYKIKFKGVPLTPRIIETIAEPLFCFCIGLVLCFLGQAIGPLIMLCSVFYAISYICAYKFADEVFMDMQDAQERGEIIHNHTVNNATVKLPNLPNPTKPTETEDVL